MHWKLDPPSSVYGGHPRPETDEVWDRMTANEWIDGTAIVLSVDEEAIKRSRKLNDEQAWLNSTVKLSNYSDRDGYMGTLDMFHQLHCLNMVRKVVYRDYYEPRLPKMFGNKEFWEHIDHCLETLRQSLMCTGNTELITFHWVKGWPGPVPDFNVWHGQCRDPEEILAWAQERAVDIKGPLVKPKNGIVELEERP